MKKLFLILFCAMLSISAYSQVDGGGDPSITGMPSKKNKYNDLKLRSIQVSANQEVGSVLTIGTESGKTKVVAQEAQAFLEDNSVLYNTGVNIITVDSFSTGDTIFLSDILELGFSKTFIMLSPTIDTVGGIDSIYNVFCDLTKAQLYDFKGMELSIYLNQGSASTVDVKIDSGTHATWLDSSVTSDGTPSGLIESPDALESVVLTDLLGTATFLIYSPSETSVGTFIPISLQETASF